MKLTFVASSIALAFVMPSSAMAAGPSKQECVAADDAAQDLRQAGKFRATREKLAVCAAASCPGPVRDDCAQRIDELNKAQPAIIFEAKDAEGNDVSAVRVTIDGQPFAAKLDGSATQVDPGEHHFTFEDADGIAHTEKTIVVREGEKERHERIVLGATSATSSAGRSAPPSATGATSDSSPQRTIGLVVGSVGMVGLILGGVFGFVSKSTYNHALQDECGGSLNACTTQGAQDGASAHSQATVSTIGFLVGGGLLAGGVILYFTAPRSGGVGIAPTVGTKSGGLGIVGAW